jgi:ribosomal protein S18 acetylase RimI-like enzyme
MIRLLELKDYEKAKKLVYQVHSLHYNNRPDIYLEGNPLPMEYFEGSIDDVNSLNCVYEEDGDIIGLLMATKKINNSIPIAKKRTTYFIEDIVVDNNYRRKGIGKKLYIYLQDKARKENIDAIELNVLAFNDSAINFYESLGMSVKNMKLEKILTDDNIELKEQKMIITNKVGYKNK